SARRPRRLVRQPAGLPQLGGRPRLLGWPERAVPLPHGERLVGGLGQSRLGDRRRPRRRLRGRLSEPRPAALPRPRIAGPPFSGGDGCRSTTRKAGENAIRAQRGRWSSAAIQRPLPRLPAFALVRAVP